MEKFKIFRKNRAPIPNHRLQLQLPFLLRNVETKFRLPAGREEKPKSLKPAAFRIRDEAKHGGEVVGGRGGPRVHMRHTV